MPTSTTTDAMTVKFLLILSSDYKDNLLKDFAKLTEQWAIIWVAVICINLKSSLIFILIINHAHWKTADALAMNFFQKLSFYYTYIVLKDIQVGTKLMRWWAIIWIAVQFKKIHANIAKDDLQYLVTPTS